MTNKNMTERELQQYLKVRFPKEDASCDWKEMKNLKNSFANDPHKDVVSYLSGISNMEGGHLVIGVKDGSLEIVGTDLSKVGFDKTSVIHKMLEQCTNLPEEGLSVEEFITTDTNKVVWIINIPKHYPRRPVIAHKKRYQRRNDSLIELTHEREEAILKEDLGHYDWSAQIVSGATIDDLDQEAIATALEGFCERYPSRADEARNWPTSVFLDKAKVTKDGQITNTALLLLGKEESAHRLNHIAQMVWRLQTDGERAATIYYPPFLLSTIKLRDIIRNYRMKIFPNNALLPADIWKYDSRTILEALHNCILHQDYSMNERIVVTEYVDKLVFTNAGSFYDGQYEDYIGGEKTPTRYRNQFMQTAMVNLKMVDSQGYGIHDMYVHQKERYLPLPDYDKSTETHVILEVPGHVINKEYSETLMENTSIDLLTTFLLDRVQKGKSLTDDAARRLRKLKLIEGRRPNYYISRTVAKVTHQEVEYTDMSAFDDQWYTDLIVKALKEHGRLKRSDFNKLLIPKLSIILNESQKRNKIDRLLRKLRQDRVIRLCDDKYWELT